MAVTFLSFLFNGKKFLHVYLFVALPSSVSHHAASISISHHAPSSFHPSLSCAQCRNSPLWHFSFSSSSFFSITTFFLHSSLSSSSLSCSILSLLSRAWTEEKIIQSWRNFLLPYSSSSHCPLSLALARVCMHA